MAKKQKIGIFGGTFNPVHSAHIIIAEHFKEELGLDRVIFIPAHISPFKTADQSAVTVESRHRVAMLRLAITDNPFLELETYEIDKKGISHTIDTINYLKKKSPSSRYRLPEKPGESHSHKQASISTL